MSNLSHQLIRMINVIDYVYVMLNLRFTRV